MKIEYYTDNKTEEIFNVIYIPCDSFFNVEVTYCKTDHQNNGIGSIELYWIKENKESDSVFLRFNLISYIIIDDKDKFIIKNREDLYELYKYFTKSDANLFLKKFKALDKVKSLEGDFK